MILIDTVYQKVLAIANKEQRGYITPQEFNLFANQAQMEIFEQYFYDINQFKRTPGNSTEYSDPVDILEEKISAFEKFKIATTGSSNNTTLPSDVYRLGTVFYNNGTNSIVVEKVSNKEIQIMNQTDLYKPTEKRPVYTRTSATKIVIYPTSATPSFSTSTLNCNNIAKPATPNWTYTVVVGKALHNSTASDIQDFELHASEEERLVLKILQLAGVSIKDNFLSQAASAAENSNIQQEKQ